MKKPYWTHKKYKTKFIGSYQWLGYVVEEGGLIEERVFVLTNGKRTVSFESHQATKKQNWAYHK
jgi:hypothetical protein